MTASDEDRSTAYEARFSPDGRRRAGASTRARLLEAATDLVARHGAEGLTVRAVSESAGTNVGAVSYHFGSREALLAEVVANASAPVLEAQRRGLDALEQASKPTPREWVEAWGRPLLAPAFSSGVAAQRLGAIIGQALAAPSTNLDALVRGGRGRCR